MSITQWFARKERRHARSGTGDKPVLRLLSPVGNALCRTCTSGPSEYGDVSGGITWSTYLKIMGP